MEPVRGYRSWEWGAFDGTLFLRSHFTGDYWPHSSPMESKCACKKEHSCGIYAWSSGEKLNDYLPMAIIAGLWVRGEVDMWGEVHFHEHGYRAQFAKPSAFYVNSQQTERTKRVIGVIALQYDVPVVQEDS